MLNLGILEDTKKVQEHQDGINRTMQKMREELAAIDRDSLKESVVVDKERAVRRKFEPVVREHLKEITDIANAQRQIVPFWESREYIASCLPVTKPLAANVPFIPADADKEMATRSALAAEYSRMSPHVLELHFQAAKSKGEAGKCYLMESVNRLRDNPAPFDLSGVELPHQAAVIDVVRSTKAARMAAENSWRESNGSRVSGAAKLAAAYEAAGPVVQLTSDERLRQRAIDEKRGN